MPTLFAHDKYRLFLPFIIAVGLFLFVELLISLSFIEDKLQSKVENWLQWKLEDVQADRPEKEDVLAFGSSRTLHGFNSALFESSIGQSVNAYNYGISFGNYYLFQLILERHVARYGKPRIVLLEISDFLLKKDTMPADNIVYFQTLIKDNPPLLQEILASPQISLANKWEIVFASLSGIYRYRDLLSPQKVIQTLWSVPNSRTLEQGWKPHKNSGARHTEKELKEHATQRVYRILGNYQELDIEKLRGFLAYCQKNGIRVVLLQWPNHRTYQNQFENHPAIQKFNHAVAGVVKESGLTYIRLGSDDGVDDAANFADSDHLGETGASHYTRRLAGEINLSN